MKIQLTKNNINKINNLNIDNLIIGNFDGVHKGHIKLILKNKNNSILLIKNIPNKKEYIYNWNNKIKDIKATISPNNILIFDLKKDNCSALDFINNYLNNLKIKTISIGSDFIFGYDRQNIDYLRNHLDKNIKLRVINRRKNSISTSKIKRKILLGKIKYINNFLLQKYNIHGKVVYGNQIASKILGIPTANLKTKKNQIIPKDGIYLTCTLFKNKYYKSVTFIGKSKTFKTNSNKKIETHLINYKGLNFYKENINIIFIEKIGNVKKYNNVKDLKTDINNYILYANKK